MMQIDNRTSEVQANAIARASCLVVLGNIESLEDMPEIFFLNSNSIVLDLDFSIFLSIRLLDSLDCQDDTTSTWSVFESIGKQIHDDLVEIVGVDPDKQL